MIFLPIKSESKVRRLPLITLSLIGINCIVFMFTYPIMIRDDNLIQKKNEQLCEYEYKMYIQHFNEDKAINFQEYATNLNKMREKIQNKEFGLTDEEWEEWNRRYQEYKEAIESRFTKRFGFTSTDFNLVTLITHLFLHAGFAHLFGNMWFLWLVGCNIEDEWGRPFFFSFYLLSGVIASAIFAIISQSSAPLIGASGAIAGVMGAFAVRHYNTKIRFLFIWFLPPIITTFSIYAGIFLPFWFIQQLFQAFLLSAYSNVAFWAHIAGFGFGAITVVVMKYYGLEEKFLKPLVDDTLNLVDTDFSKAVEARSKGDVDTAEGLLEKKLNENPADVRTAEELIDLYCLNGKKKEAEHIAKICFRELRKKKADRESILSFYETQLRERELLSTFNPYDFYYIADLYSKNNQYNKSSRVLAIAYKNYRDSNDAPYILLRLIKTLYKSKDKKFFKKAAIELKKRFPEMESKAKAMIKEEKSEPR